MVVRSFLHGFMGFCGGFMVLTQNVSRYFMMLSKPTVLLLHLLLFKHPRVACSRVSVENSKVHTQLLSETGNIP